MAEFHNRVQDNSSDYCNARRTWILQKLHLQPHLDSRFIKIIEQQTSGIQGNSGSFDQRMTYPKMVHNAVGIVFIINELDNFVIVVHRSFTTILQSSGYRQYELVSCDCNRNPSGHNLVLRKVN
jgi:hypothetical protein